VVLKDKACTEQVLRIIMDKPDLKVLKVETQYDLKSLSGRSLELDVKAVDARGKMYDIEVQRDSKGASPRRARYHSALLDSDLLKPGSKMRELPESIIIFITEEDVLLSGLPIYHIKRVVEETGEAFEDGSSIIYVNSQVQDETELGKLMQDLWCTEADKMHNKVLARKARYLKETEKGVRRMCKIFDEVKQEGVAVGIAQGEDRINQLGEKLISLGRTEDLLRSMVDRLYQKQLLKEFGI